MLSKPSRRKRWQSMLNRRINELIEVAKHIEPETEIIIHEPFEDEDAVVEFLVPPEKFDDVYESVTHKSTQIWWEDGFDIVVWVHEKKPVEVKEAE